MMSKKSRIELFKCLSGEKGQALIMVLVFMLLGSLVITPLLSFLGTALSTGRIYEDKTDALYAADAGVEDAIWQIKYDNLDSLFTDPAYDEYDFSSNWTYNLSEQINNEDTTINIKNIWIPKGIDPPDKTTARNIIETGKLIISGNAPSDSDYKIKVTFYPGEGEEDALMVKQLGIWLPLGFSYVEGTSNLEQADPEEDEYYSEPDIQLHAGGQAVIWDYSSVNFTFFPGVDPEGTPLMTEITFQYSSNQTGIRPSTVSWIKTSGVADVALSWDADVKVYRIISTADETEIEAYSIKCELRKLGSTIAGDYRAIGNSLMKDTEPDSNCIREELLSESDATVSNIPSDAVVVGAYLYWSGWFERALYQWEDSCDNFTNWETSGNNWTYYSGIFQGDYVGGDNETRYLTMKESLDLSGYASGTAEVFWEQWERGGDQLEEDDALRFQFSYDGGSPGSWSEMFTAFADDIGSSPQSFNYTIPDLYLVNNFKMRFFLDGFGGSKEYCRIDNIGIGKAEFRADTSAIFKINNEQVCFDEQGQPKKDDKEIIASQWSILENEPGEFSYACFRDVTKLVQAYSNLGDHQNHTGNGIYTIGDVDAHTSDDWSYAGWSLIIIYSSAETYGKQLYLYDDFIYSPEGETGNPYNIDFDGDGQPGGTITGFIVPEPVGGEENAARLTCFVGEGDNCWWNDSLKFNGAYLSNDESPWNNMWNSKSPDMSEDGVDIDTCNITWTSGLLEPGDSSAQLDLPTVVDSWNLVYVILALRSETVTGGTTHYVILSN
jgi:hypothetical protein